MMRIRRILTLPALLTLIAWPGIAVAEPSPDEGWSSVFNGKDLAGWKSAPDNPAVFTVTPEGWLDLKGGSGYLESDGSYDDFTLQLEAIINGDKINSGIFFRSIPGEEMNGYESQIQNGYEDNDRTYVGD